MYPNTIFEQYSMPLSDKSSINFQDSQHAHRRRMQQDQVVSFHFYRCVLDQIHFQGEAERMAVGP